jgi:hypothetical protein
LSRDFHFACVEHAAILQQLRNDASRLPRATLGFGPQ